MLNFMSRWFFCVFLLRVVFFVPQAEGFNSFQVAPGAPSWLEIPDVDRVIHVDQKHPLGSDVNPGSSKFPMRSIGAATHKAVENRKRGFSTKIIVSPGIYREQIKLEFTKKKNDPVIVFESEKPGEAIISGADVWTEWKEVGTQGVYVHAWPYKWGLVPYPLKWDGQVKLEPIVRRKEIVSVAGQLLSQVLSFGDLIEGTFFISEEDGRIYVFPRPKNIETRLSAEVGVRSNLFQISGKKGVVVRGLTFQHDASGIQGAAVWFVDSKDILVEDCEFRFNNWTGLSLHNVQHVTTRRNRSIENGGAGMVAWKTKAYLSEDDETSRNNWRGLEGNFFYWAVGGFKVMRTHAAIFRRHQARQNHTGGLWFDSDNSNIVLEDNLWCGNLKHGLFLEASQGPFLIKDNIIVNNREIGVRVLYAQDLFFNKNVIKENDGSQIQIRGKKELLIDDWETGRKIKVKNLRYLFEGNTIEGNNLVIDIDSFQDFISSFRSQNNHWFKPGGNAPFKIVNEQLSFTEWKILTNQDLDSKFDKAYQKPFYNDNDCQYKNE